MEKQIKLLISEFLVHLALDFTDIEVGKKDDQNYFVNVVSDQPSLLIGHHGENLRSMQKVITVMVHSKIGDDITLHFDVDSYRRRQEENVLTITKQKINEVRETKNQSALPPMSPYFRRIVHLFVRDGDYNDVETESIGEGNYRQVVIKLKS
jgi:spoIIIJ-associated protein